MIGQHGDRVKINSELIRERLHTAGLTEEKLCEELKICTRPTYWRWSKNGLWKPWQVELLSATLYRFGIELAVCEITNETTPE